MICYDFIHFYIGWPHWETKPSVTQHLLICPLSAAYWSLIKHTTFLLCQHQLLTLWVEYVMPKTCQIRRRSLQSIMETYHTHRISAKPPVLKIFIRVHFLMELLNLPRSRSPETTAGWRTVLQRWHRSHIETGGRRNSDSCSVLIPRVVVVPSRAEIYP